MLFTFQCYPGHQKDRKLKYERNTKSNFIEKLYETSKLKRYFYIYKQE